MKPIYLLLVLLSVTQLGYGADWPSFLGPSGNGITEPANYPTRWSDTENVLWSAPMPRPGNGSPIVVGDKVLVAAAEDDAGHKRSLLCFDAATGQQLWNQTVECEH